MSDKETKMIILEGGMHVHVCSKRGKGRPKMEDSWLVLPQVTRTGTDDPGPDGRPSCSVFAVFDGHGGLQAARYAREHLQEVLKSSPGFWSNDDEDILSSLTSCFRVLHNKMEDDSGEYSI